MVREPWVPRMRIEVDAPIIVATLPGELGARLYHLPIVEATRNRSVHNAVKEWPTLCGLAGNVFVYNGAARERRVCSVCRAAMPAGQLTLEGTYVESLPAKRRNIRMPTRVPQLTDRQAEVMYRIYVEKHVGTPALASLFWERLGYANSVSCSNQIVRAFAQRGYTLRSRGESVRRTVEGRRAMGYGGYRTGERRLSARIVDRLWSLYAAGWSTPQITARFHRRFGYADAVRFRSVLEYAWKSEGRKLRTNSEAELLARARLTKHCAAMKTGADGRGPRPCSQRPLNGSDYCLHHDPAHQEAVRARADALRARKVLKPRVPWSIVKPHLTPLLVPRPDRFGRLLERESGALARSTGIDPAICSRYLKGRHETITVDYANKFLAPLGLTVDELQPELLAA